MRQCSFKLRRFSPSFRFAPSFWDLPELSDAMSSVSGGVESWGIMRLQKRPRLDCYHVLGMNILNKIHTSLLSIGKRNAHFFLYVQYTGYCYVRSIRAKRRTEKLRPGRFSSTHDKPYTYKRKVGSCYICISLLYLYLFSNYYYVYISLVTTAVSAFS